METDAGEVGPVEVALELPQHVGAFGRRPDPGREDEILILPPVPSREPLFQLADAMLAECGEGEAGQGYGSARLFSLQLGELKLPINPLDLTPDVQDAGLVVHVGPLQAEYLT